MKKKCFIKACLVVLCIILIAITVYALLTRPKTDYSEAEVKSAIQVVQEGPGSVSYLTITNLHYDQEATKKAYAENRDGLLKKRYGSKILVLRGDIAIGDNVPQGTGFEAGTVQPDYQFIMVQSDKDSQWELADGGYP